jgi:hypothetical protein
MARCILCLGAGMVEWDIRIGGWVGTRDTCVRLVWKPHFFLKDFPKPLVCFIFVYVFVDLNF